MSKASKVEAVSWMVRIQTGRGTDHSHCILLPQETPKADVIEESEYYARKYVAGTSIESYTVSVRRFAMPKNRSVIAKRYSLARKLMDIARHKTNEALAALTAFDQLKESRRAR